MTNNEHLTSKDFPTFGAYARYIDSLTSAEREARRVAKAAMIKAREAAERAARKAGA